MPRAYPRVVNWQLTNNNIQIDSRKINKAAEDKGIETGERVSAGSLNSIVRLKLSGNTVFELRLWHIEILKL